MSLRDIPQYMDCDLFDLNNKKCSWMTIEEMENNSAIMEKNDYIIAFVKTKLK